MEEECSDSNESDDSSDYDFEPYSPVSSSDELSAEEVTSSESDGNEGTDVTAGMDTSQSDSQLMALETHSSGNTGTLSYKLVGDNIDKTVKHRYMRVDKHRKNESMHYFHAFAVRDRIDFSSLSNHFPSISSLPFPDEIVKTLLPSKEDDEEMKSNMIVLMSRVLVDHLDFFKISFEGTVDWHIRHPFQSQMSKKSEVVSAIFILIYITKWYFECYSCISAGSPWNFAI